MSKKLLLGKETLMEFGLSALKSVNEQTGFKPQYPGDVPKDAMPTPFKPIFQKSPFGALSMAGTLNVDNLRDNLRRIDRNIPGYLGRVKGRVAKADKFRAPGLFGDKGAYANLGKAKLSGKIVY